MKPRRSSGCGPRRMESLRRLSAAPIPVTARISIYTGLPTVLGWGNHEGQWRDGALQGTRAADIELLYTTNDWVTTQEIISRYHIRYIYVGNLERSTYRVNEEKFNRFLKPVFSEGTVTIYEAP